jgi:hypothetical protein
MAIQDLILEQDLVRFKKEFDEKTAEFDGVVLALKQTITNLKASPIYETIANKDEKALTDTYQAKIDALPVEEKSP